MSHIFKISMNYRKYGYDIRTVQELLGHKDVKTTMIYTPVIKKRRPRSPKPPVGQACLPVPACRRAGADTAVGQARLRSGRLDFYPKINRRFRVKSTRQKMNVDFSHLSQHSLLFPLAF
ncbi:MAG: hypothetical protein KCCBMMGE_00244 [Candidatus Methanoperedenaceae archaeon GB37]|nr:MAG: hypothetical protein KCCBMMGE_00244 [Candidatus Methanoperedenaceae archaeon GB37]CAD7778823.1 hypothetical protein DMNBHIDG_01890 [Candidatus Methanoperedenaceae archaeon GB37]